mmetsp:Transcript_126177/g.269166  ORF Transcript_126177/g.269166 Transcript_126177/m.269166 type:complete len:229 (-) Transcript_126177:1041-1727(-)
MRPPAILKKARKSMSAMSHGRWAVTQELMSPGLPTCNLRRMKKRAASGKTALLWFKRVVVPRNKALKTTKRLAACCVTTLSLPAEASTCLPGTPVQHPLTTEPGSTELQGSTNAPGKILAPAATIESCPTWAPAPISMGPACMRFPSKLTAARRLCPCTQASGPTLMRSKPAILAVIMADQATSAPSMRNPRFLRRLSPIPKAQPLPFITKVLLAAKSTSQCLRKYVP